MSEAVYLFCFAKPDLLPGEQLGVGVDGQSPLFLVTERGVAAVVSTVMLADFQGEEAEKRLSDPDWVTPRALRHEAVIERVARSSPVFPARFGTLFSSEERLRALLVQHYDAIRQFLEQAQDREEWAVKGFLDRDVAADALVTQAIAAPSGGQAASKGAQYMRAQSLRARAQAEVSTWADEACDRVLQDLMRLAQKHTERKVLPSAPDEPAGDMVVNWAFWVPVKHVPEFRARVEQANEDLSRRGLSFREAGALPPFSFTPALQSEA